MSSSSVSKLSLFLEIKVKSKIKFYLKRHLAPTLVGMINRSLPLQGNVHVLDKNCIYFETSVDAGLQRTRREFKKGDIAFLSVGHAICFFQTDSKVRKEMSPIGKILDDPKLLENAESGDEIILYCATG